MKRLAMAVLLAATFASADAPRVNRNALAKVEKAMETTLSSGEHPSELFGNAQAVYIDGFGAVLITRVALIPTPVENPFRTLTREDIAGIHDRKLAQVPRLKEKMREMLFTLAADPGLEGVRAHEQVVCGVTMFYYKWEKTEALPFQIVMQAEKQQLLDARAGRLAKPDLDALVKVQEL